jgi:hypothetical protein
MLTKNEIDEIVKRAAKSAPSAIKPEPQSTFFEVVGSFVGGVIVLAFGLGLLWGFVAVIKFFWIHS